MLLRISPAALFALSQRDWLVVGLGIGVVFAGLIALIVICYLLAAISGGKAKSGGEPKVKAADAAPRETTKAIENRSELAAVIAVAIAQEMGCEPEGLRIHSIRKIN